MKEVLFSHGDDERSLGKSAQRMMMHLSISIDDDVQQTLSFFEKVSMPSCYCNGLALLFPTHPPKFLILSFNDDFKSYLDLSFSVLMIFRNI